MTILARLTRIAAGSTTERKLGLRPAVASRGPLSLVATGRATGWKGDR